jgi:hypothetical protein
MNKREVATIQKKKRKERVFSIAEVPETGELEITAKATDKNPEAKVRFPKDKKERIQLPPREFEQVQNAIEAVQWENRLVEVYADSLESCIGYDGLLRILSKVYNSHVAYLRSERGGRLSLEEARAQAYRRDLTDEEATKHLESLMRLPAHNVSFWDLMSLNHNSPAAAQNLWEMIKREAAVEFESGHKAAEAFEPADYMVDAWNRATYLGFRESLCEEWQPKGGIELSMIDAIAQAWLQLQFWTTESVKRATTEPRRETRQFEEWRKYQNAVKKQWDNGYWDIPYVYEQEAISQAAQMADRWQRMYFRAIRNLRDWRRYTPQVTINNPQQVNIAADGGQQINVNSKESSEKEEVIEVKMIET